MNSITEIGVIVAGRALACRVLDTMHRRRRTSSMLSLFLAGATVFAAPAVQDTGTRPELATLLGRAGEYVRSYHQTLSTVIADELYDQHASNGTESKRRLESEFALVQGGPGEVLWLAIRDVMKVDGQPIADRSRLKALLANSRGNLRAGARAIAEEQAKYNIGDVYRTINVPTLPLEFLLPDRQSRFRFKITGTATVSGVESTAVAYDEREKPTIIRTPNGANVVSRGSVWLDDRGRVLKTELLTSGPRGLRAAVTVTYAVEPRLEILVPATMSESYSSGRSMITAVATYSNFRRFETEARIVR
jgi:hypothetical protein